MDHSGTDCIDLDEVAVSEAASSGAVVTEMEFVPAPRFCRRRPMAGFLTHLLVSTNPTLQSARSERTKAAAALYARAAAFAKRA